MFISRTEDEMSHIERAAGQLISVTMTRAHLIAMDAGDNGEEDYRTI